MEEGFKVLDEMESSDEPEDDISISPSELDSRKNHVRKVTNFSRGRGQSVREWIEPSQVKPNPDGFSEYSDIPDQVKEYLSSDDHSYVDISGFNAKATKPGVTSVARELYENDLVTVETPEMDRSGVSGNIEIGVDQERISDYIEEIEDEFAAAKDPKPAASAAVGVAMESIFNAVEENYEGRVDINTHDKARPWNAIPDSVTPSGAGPDDDYGLEIEDASYLRDAGEAVISKYRENIREAEQQRRMNSSREQEDDGFLGIF